MKSKLDIRLLYLALHNQLCKKFGSGNLFTRKEFFTKLGKHYMIPKNLRYQVIKEMEEMNLLKLVNRDTLEILSFEINIEEDSHRIIQLMNL